MSALIEDYAIIGDCHTAALVAKNGSIDWLCFPQFDSAACFSALLGDERHGRFLISPTDSNFKIERKYVKSTLVLQTTFINSSGTVCLTDFMEFESKAPGLVRMIECLEGEVSISVDCFIRFNYGSVTPWLQKEENGFTAIAGPDLISLSTQAPLEILDGRICGKFLLKKNQSYSFQLHWMPSISKSKHIYHGAEVLLKHTLDRWGQWSAKNNYHGLWSDSVQDSTRVLKALTHKPSGGIVAALTTSLPESFEGGRNWDYRYCWIRDSTFVLYALMLTGYKQEAKAWRDWLLRAVAGEAKEIQIMYGIKGERELLERCLDWLPGYENVGPVLVGNNAHKQRQLDVPGEIMDSFHFARRCGLASTDSGWRMQRTLMDFLESHWSLPDEGIWEVRGERRHFVYSKVMAWVAFDRAIKAIEHFQLEGPLEKWKVIRKKIHSEVCEKGIHSKTKAFVNYYGTDEPDASLLLIPLVGFLPANDERVIATIKSVEQFLKDDVFVYRYRPNHRLDGVKSKECAFLACSFWYVDNLCLLGRYDEAKSHFEKLLLLRNDVGLLSEQYDIESKRMMGNFPQAFSHVALINSAFNLTSYNGPAHDRKTP